MKTVDIRATFNLQYKKKSGNFYFSLPGMPEPEAYNYVGKVLDGNRWRRIYLADSLPKYWFFSLLKTDIFPIYNGEVLRHQPLENSGIAYLKSKKEVRFAYGKVFLPEKGLDGVTFLPQSQGYVICRYGYIGISGSKGSFLELVPRVGGQAKIINGMPSRPLIRILVEAFPHTRLSMDMIDMYPRFCEEGIQYAKSIAGDNKTISFATFWKRQARYPTPAYSEETMLVLASAIFRDLKKNNYN